MDIKATVSVSGGGFGDISKAMSISASGMKTIGRNARKRMNDRINSSKDINGNRYTGKLAYSEGYKNYKRKLSKNPNRVDMRDSGTMRNSIRVDSKINIATIAVTLHRLIGYYHQSGRA